MAQWDKMSHPLLSCNYTQAQQLSLPWRDIMSHGDPRLWHSVQPAAKIYFRYGCNNLGAIWPGSGILCAPWGVYCNSTGAVHGGGHDVAT